MGIFYIEKRGPTWGRCPNTISIFLPGPSLLEFQKKNQELIELLMSPHGERRVELMIFKRGLGLAKD